MKPPLYVRPLTVEERQALEAGLRSGDGVTVRRSQILLASASGQTPNQIGQSLHCSGQLARQVIKAFHQEGLSAIAGKSRRPVTVFPMIDESDRDRFYHLLHHSPRQFGKAHSLWSLDRLAEVSFEQGLTPRVVSHETIRRTLLRFGINWKRAIHWINSPDPEYQANTNGATD